MSIILDKIKQYYKKAAFFAVVFVIVFALGFYLVNMDISFGKKTISPDIFKQDQKTVENTEIKKRSGSLEIDIADFAVWAKANNLADVNSYDADPDADRLPNYLEYIHGTDPNNADTDSDGFSDSDEIIHGYDPDAKGDIKVLTSVRIEKIGIEAPMIWSKDVDEKKTLADLEKGLSHYPASGSPGQDGNMIISGHSSNYFWAKGDYNYIFKDLNALEIGNNIIVKTLQRNGKIISYRYKVNDKFVASPDDEKIFKIKPGKNLTLSTCWPLGTNFKRLIVQAELVK